jgi:hypothetical protein
VLQFSGTQDELAGHLDELAAEARRVAVTVGRKAEAEQNRQLGRQEAYAQAARLIRGASIVPGMGEAKPAAVAAVDGDGHTTGRPWE